MCTRTRSHVHKNPIAYTQEQKTLCHSNKEHMHGFTLEDDLVKTGGTSYTQPERTSAFETDRQNSDRDQAGKVWSGRMKPVNGN